MINFSSLQFLLLILTGWLDRREREVLAATLTAPLERAGQPGCLHPPASDVDGDDN